MSKLGTFVKYALVGTVAYYVGKRGLAYWREQAGMVVGKVLPKAQQALAAGYTQAMGIVNAAMQQAGVTGTVTPGTSEGKPALIVKVPEGTDYEYVESQVPPVAAGIPVVVQ